MVFSGKNVFAWFTLTCFCSLVLNCVQGSDDSQCPVEKRMNLFCYVGIWYSSSFSAEQLQADDVDPYLCTHIVLSYIVIRQDVLTVGFDQNPLSDFKFERFVRDMITEGGKNKRNTAYLFNIGGYNDFNPGTYEMIARSETARDEFFNNLIKFLQDYHVQGIDFMWNYIGRDGHDDTGDKQTHLKLLTAITVELCPTLKEEGFICMITLVKAERPDLLDDPAYNEDIATIVRVADFVNIWTADILHAPIAYPSYHLVPQDLLIADDEAVRSYYAKFENKSINFVVDFYKNALKKEPHLLRKISMVIPMQSGTNVVKSPTENSDSLSINTETFLHDGNFVSDDGRALKYQYPYFLVCRDLNKNSSTWEIKEFPGGVPIAYTDEYEGRTKVGVAMASNTESYVKKKVKFARKNNLGGISVFQIFADDVKGWCANQSYPIINAINEELSNCRFQ